MLTSGVSDGPGAPRYLTGGLPRASEGTGQLGIVSPGQLNPETAVFGSGCRAHRARQCFSPVGETVDHAKGRRGVRDGEGLLKMEGLKMEIMILLRGFTE